MKVYVTKYALTLGIKAVECEEGDSGRLYPKEGQCFHRWTGLKLGKDAHKTYDEAVKAAEAMVLKKVAALEKQAMKLRKMKFPKEAPR